MSVFVKRYRVRHNGVTYGPGQPGGQIIEDLFQQEEDSLIQGSMGYIEKYVPPQLPEQTSVQTDISTKNTKTDNQKKDVLPQPRSETKTGTQKLGAKKAVQKAGAKKAGTQKAAAKKNVPPPKSQSKGGGEISQENKNPGENVDDPLININPDDLIKPVK